MTDDELAKLTKKAAGHLSKHQVRVFLRAPVIKNFDGMAYHFEGTDTIHIKPFFDARARAGILAHESAHILQGTASNINPSLPPGSLELTLIGAWARKIAQAPGGNESRAEEQAAIWMDYCDRYYNRYPAPTELESRLLALADYPMAEMLDRAQAAGAAAGKAAALKHIRR